MTRPEVDPGSRFQRRNLGELQHPGQCLVCGSGNRQEGYVDLSTYFDYEGQMYLCAYCMEEAAATIGCLSESQSDALQLSNLRLLTELQEVKDKLEHAESRLAGIDMYLAPLTSAVSSALAPVQPAEDEPASDSSTDATVSAADSGKPVVTKSVKVTRRNDSARASISDDSIQL